MVAEPNPKETNVIAAVRAIAREKAESLRGQMDQESYDEAVAAIESDVADDLGVEWPYPQGQTNETD